MTTYQVFMLSFRTSVHFGDSGGGGGLGDVLSFCRADTFFSALCNEAVKIEEGLFDTLVNKTIERKILFSDLMPWHCGIEGRYDLYIPRPFLSVSSERRKNSYEKSIEDAIERKKMKKRAYIRASQWDGYLEYMQTGELSDNDGKKLIDPEPEFGKFVLNTHFNGRTTKPYQCGSYYFMDNAGLYLVVAAEDKEDLEWLKRLISLVGLSGIGGRRSCGSGKFVICGRRSSSNSKLAFVCDPREDELLYEGDGDPFILSKKEFYGPDDAALYEMLINDEAGVQMALASVIPSEDEITAVHEGTGKLIKRSGFAFSCEIGKPVKVNSIYMMSSGSCFKQRVAGRVADVNNGMAPHPVHRYGNGLYVGLSL